MRNYTIINPDPALKNNLLAFGFMCGVGWHPLIFEMMDEIQDIVDRDNLDDFEITEIKEKYGKLRVYTTHYIEEIATIIRKYEDRSSRICELCGKRGRARNINKWITTICDECYTEMKK